MESVIIDGQTTTQRQLALSDVFLQTACCRELFEWIEVLDSETLLGEAAGEECPRGASVAVHEGTNGHQAQPQTCTGVDECGGSGIFVEDSVKLTQTNFQFLSHAFARGAAVGPTFAFGGGNHAGTNRRDAPEFADASVEHAQVINPRVFALDA